MRGGGSEPGLSAACCRRWLRVPRGGCGACANCSNPAMIANPACRRQPAVLRSGEPDLFPGDMGASLLSNAATMAPVTAFQAHVRHMQNFHARYMDRTWCASLTPNGLVLNTACPSRASRDCRFAGLGGKPGLWRRFDDLRAAPAACGSRIAAGFPGAAGLNQAVCVPAMKNARRAWVQPDRQAFCWPLSDKRKSSVSASRSRSLPCLPMPHGQAVTLCQD